MRRGSWMVSSAAPSSGGLPHPGGIGAAIGGGLDVLAGRARSRSADRVDAVGAGEAREAAEGGQEDDEGEETENGHGLAFFIVDHRGAGSLPQASRLWTARQAGRLPLRPAGYLRL